MGAQDGIPGSGTGGPRGDVSARPGVAAVAVVAALSLALFTLVTVEDLPIGLLPEMARDLDVSVPRAGLLVTGYGVTVAVASVPLTRLTRGVPRRILLPVLLAVATLATLLSAVAGGYWALLAARAALALVHAVFWSVVVATAAGLFPPGRRGKIIAGLLTGASLAAVAGVPAGTWLGQRTTWRVPFLVAAGAGLLALIVVAALLPATRPEENPAAVGSAPSPPRFRRLMVATALLVTGVFVVYTYLAAYLTTAAGFPSRAVGPVLLAAGVAGIVGTNVAGVFVDRRPRTVMAVAAALMACALLGLSALRGVPAAVVAAVSLLWLALALYNTAQQSRVLVVAPGSTELASAAGSAVFNAGIAAGALVGGAVLAGPGVRAVPLAGGALVAGALVVLLREPPGQGAVDRQLR